MHVLQNTTLLPHCLIWLEVLIRCGRDMVLLTPTLCMHVYFYYCVWCTYDCVCAITVVVKYYIRSCHLNNVSFYVVQVLLIISCC